MSQGGPLNTEDLPVNVPTQFNADVGFAVPVLNQINVFGAGGASTSAVGNTITVLASGSGYNWQVITSASNPVTLANNNGYIVKGALPVNFILPAAAAVGNTFKIVGTSNLWTIAQNAGQSITIGKLTTTGGVGGSVNATMISDSIELICVTQNLEFYEIQIQGNPTII